MEPNGLESRVEALETHVRELDGRVRASEHDAAAARVLAGAADRDVTEFHSELHDFRQAAVASFNAMREDMTDLRTEMRTRFASVDNGFIGIRSKLDAAAAGQLQIVDILHRLIDDQKRNR